VTVAITFPFYSHSLRIISQALPELWMLRIFLQIDFLVPGNVLYFD